MYENNCNFWLQRWIQFGGPQKGDPKDCPPFFSIKTELNVVHVRTNVPHFRNPISTPSPHSGALVFIIPQCDNALVVKVRGQ